MKRNHFNRSINPLAMHIGMTGAFLQGQESAVNDMQQMIRGMQRYQASDYFPESQPYDVIWECGQTSLRLMCGNQKKSAENIFLVPSMINKSDIFDLCEKRSMVKWFYDHGYNVYLLDWGDLSAENIGIEDLICERLAVALKHIKSKSDQKLHCLGYCMGGILSLGAAFKDETNIDSLILLASPWDFHRGAATLLQRIKFWAPSALMQSEKNNVLGANSLQMLFASVEPLLAQKKFSKFLDVEEGSVSEKIFIAVEDWLNDGVDIPNVIAVETIQNWYGKNCLALGEWRIKGERVDIHSITIPVLIVASRNDRLVDFESSISVKECIEHADLIEPNCGHIGMIAGARSIEDVWSPILDWIKNV